jgi:plasmid stabilization system protein ParE
LNRLGWMREVVLGPDSNPSEATYFGVLSSSPEESLDHARKSVDAQPAGRAVFAAANGRHTAGHSRSAVTHFEYGAGALWSDRGLIEQAQSSFQPGVNWRETSWPNSPKQTPPTFLLLLATLLKQRSRRAVGRYVYNEQEYQMELDAPQAGRNRERLLPVRGKIRNLRTGYETLFRLWLEEASDSIVPVRFEVQPRSFLRLTFESVTG